ncbi:MAG TPA: DUF4157 domain-containing protein [Kofleriaceae bacterium]|nr:DUF4157 domain-containing protein [Kofleriaceae bacterium]
MRIDRKCDTCRSESEDELKLQRALAPGAAASDLHLGGLAVAPPTPVVAGGTVEVSEPDDTSERDADRMAEQALSGAAGARAVPSMGGRPRLQRAAAEPAAASPGGFIVDDEAAALLPGQMRKGEFLRALREQACAAADRELARAGRDTQGCPYLARWFDYYEQRDARHVERAVRKYAPEAARATSAAGYIPIVSARAAQAARQWAQTGALPELPEGMGAEMMGGGVLGAIGGAISAVGGAISGALSAIGSLFFKAEPGGARGGIDRGALESRLGPGQPLDGGAQARMSAAFGHDFSRVRVHADHNAAQAASGLNARAFTLGNHVAFAAGQYRPGDLVGDALLAHELAHVVQQSQAPLSASLAIDDDRGHERNADEAVVGVLTDLYGSERIGHRARRVATTGWALQRCQNHFEPLPKGKTKVPFSVDDYIAMWEQQHHKMTEDEKQELLRGCIGITVLNLQMGMRPPPLGLAFDKFDTAHKVQKAVNDILASQSQLDKIEELANTSDLFAHLHGTLLQLMVSSGTLGARPEELRAVIFTTLFWSNQSPDWEARKQGDPNAFQPGKYGQVDMSKYESLLQTTPHGKSNPEGGLNAEHTNFDFGWWDEETNTWWDADRGTNTPTGEGMTIYQRTLEGITKFYDPSGAKMFDRQIFVVALARKQKKAK